MLQVQKFMQEHKNWRELLNQPPYNLNIKDDGGFTILKYTQWSSDFSNPIVQECRGIIFKDDIPVCIPFFKFFNHIETEAAQIDWDTAVVKEKVDGSLIKVWNWDGIWHMSTNGSINAYKTPVHDEGITFGQLVDEIIPFERLTYNLNPFYTYMFELTCRENQVIVNYNQPLLWYLGRRNNATLIEDDNANEIPKIVKIPFIYDLHSLNDCKLVADGMTKDEEGFVVCDANHNRIKIKSIGWLMAQKQEKTTMHDVFDMWQAGNLDDYCGDALAIEFKENLSKIAYSLEKFYMTVKDWDRAKIARLHNRYADYAFKRLSNKTTDVYDYLRHIRYNAFNDFLI